MKKYIWPVAACVYFMISMWVIMVMPAGEVLRHDGYTYYDTARTVQAVPLWRAWIDTQPSFIDRGYPLLLAQVMKIVGTDAVAILQSINYLAWACAAYCIYQALVMRRARYAMATAMLMLFSPLYLSFGAKLYSEPVAALGCALLIWGIVGSRSLPTSIGSILLVSIKSIFAPGMLLLTIWCVYKKKYKQAAAIVLSLIIVWPLLISSWSGNRSLYNRTIQVSKAYQSFDQIFACAPYFVSYPLGQKLLPQYQGVCHQNDPTPDMPGYENNPYMKANELRERGFTEKDWMGAIMARPVRYLASMLVSLTNFVLIEGIYPSMLLMLPSFLLVITFVVTRVLLSVYIWWHSIRKIRKNWRYALPLLYLCLLVGNFQVEPRYIYPLLPYLYFLVGLRDNA